jgi:hypothetical protein
MTNQYAVGPNTGIGFITHPDREAFAVEGFPADVWVVDGSAAATAWIARNGLVVSTKAATQALVDAACKGKVGPEGKPVVAPVLE